MKHLFFIILICCVTSSGFAQKKKEKSEEKVLKSSTFSGLKFRSIGPALTSGRIADIAVNPENHSEYYVATASGGVWKTVNSGVTYEPVFDNEGSYSAGCVAIDPSNPHVIWVGTGENNNQRSVGYGDGVYKSEDDGLTWKKMGLEHTEHISKIIVHPDNSKTVYVAAYGPLWSKGGDRGLYKTTDGGKTWERVLYISENTGISDIALHPQNPDIIYAAAHQRRRHVFTYISGGPESGLFRSTDGGDNWDTLTNGLPHGDMGRIGLAVSPAAPDMVYAIIEAAEDDAGFYRSLNRGGSWKKMNKYTTSGNYYQEIVCDPLDPDRVYSLNTWGMVTVDGGKTWKRTGEKNKHVDNHALWIDPDNTQHLLAGCDGGLYESYDRAKTWQFKPNLPVTQFYKVTVDQNKPFYYVYGGTQDNFSMGGPSRTTSANGIVNSDWFITNGGDGFESQVDPVDPNIVYAQAQYGWLVRYDKKSGETIGIKPMPGTGEKPLRWNWDAPLLISPHKHTRLYFAANKLFKSEDRGNTWTAISGDLTRQIDRNKIPVMGKVWSMDAIAKNKSTSIYGNITALDESPLQEGLIYVGTDDGLIQVTENGGGSWQKHASFPGVPEKTYVNAIFASRHDPHIVFAVFNNHKNGDFKPYLLKSTDRGKTWQNIANDLPARGSVYSFIQDHKDPDLLFAGTEFGLYTSINAGKNWVRLKGGLPTICIRDMAVQKDEDDLVLATFGRGFYILDDYSPLRNLHEDSLKKNALLFPVSDALMFVASRPLGLKGKSFQGASYFTAPNPPVGATITYYLKEDIKTLREKRQEEEKEKSKNGEVISYPDAEQIRAEDREEKPVLLFTITDDKGNEVRRLKAAPKKGVHRITWDFRFPATTPATLKKPDTSNPFADVDAGYLAPPGKYAVYMYRQVNGKVTQLAGPRWFNAVPLHLATLEAEDKREVAAFEKKAAELKRVVSGTIRYNNELRKRMKLLKEAVRNTPAADIKTTEKIHLLEKRLADVFILLTGDRSLSKREFPVMPSINERVNQIVYNLWQSTSAPTQTMRDNYRIAGEQLTQALSELKEITSSLMAMEELLEKKGAPWTPGRLPVWDFH
ncbi:MAG: glycosyl hydrolase [Flavobacteriales bacterium]